MADERDERFDPPVAAGIDRTPTLVQQADKKGWEASVFNFGKAEHPSVDYFNPGLVRRPDGLWLMVRRAYFNSAYDVMGMNTIWACKLKDDLTPIGGKILQWPDTLEPREQFEDARAFYHAPTNKTFVSVCNFIWHGDGSWTGAHQSLGEFSCNPQDFDADWMGLRRIDPDIDGNGTNVHNRTRHQKNWVFFIHESKLYLLYSTHPWIVIEFKDRWDETILHTLKEGAKWDYGVIRGGTPPVLVGDLYWTFHHSSVPWTGRFRRYHMGALAFESKPPFRPVLYTPQPILTGSQKDEWKDKKPLVVFPCGAVIENGQWIITYGINDLKCGWLRMQHDDLLSKCKGIPEKFSPLLMLGNGENGASAKEDSRRERLVAQAAKARAALAKKRALVGKK